MEHITTAIDFAKSNIYVVGAVIAIIFILGTYYLIKGKFEPFKKHRKIDEKEKLEKDQIDKLIASINDKQQKVSKRDR